MSKPCKPYKTYSDEDKLSLIQRYYSSGKSKTAFCREHGICTISLLNKWISQWPGVEKSVLLSCDCNLEEMANRSKDDYKEENAQLKKRVAELEKALAFSKLETEARDLMITRAEEFFKIPIRKKSGAKQ